MNLRSLIKVRSNPTSGKATRRGGLFHASANLLCASAVTLMGTAQAEDYLFTGGAIYTATGEAAEAVYVSDGVIRYVGDVAGAEEMAKDTAERVDIGDGLLTPGFIDAHVHPVYVGLTLTIHCNLSGIGDKERILAKIAACAEEREGEEWLIGRGWALGAFEESKPSAADLDAIMPEGMAGYFWAEDGHNGWANSEAFERVRVGRETPDPEGGHIERLPDGRPQGTLRERAQQLVTAYLPMITDEQQEEALIAALNRLNQFGITTVVSAGVDTARVEQYQNILARDALTARTILALWVGPDWEEDLEGIAEQYSNDSDWLRVSQIKLMLDGVMENQTAHVSFTYPGLDHRGTTFFEDEETLTRWATAFEAAGYQLHFHTVGDEAITQGLRVLAASREARESTNNKPVFAHDYLVKPEDYEQLREAGAYMQLTMLWDQQNDSMVNLNKPFLTEQQYADLMPAEQLVAGDIPVIGGSDAPVGQFDPMASIQVAVTGQGVPYFHGGDMGEQEHMPGGRTSLEDMLRAYTITAAEALGLDHAVGSIEVGKRADLVVLDRDIQSIDPAEIYGTEVRLTLLDGKVVFRAEP